MPNSPKGPSPDAGRQVLWDDGERVFRREWQVSDDGSHSAVIVVSPAAEHPSASSLDRLAHEFALKDELDGPWAMRPLDLVCDAGRTLLVIEDADVEPLDRSRGTPMELGRSLRVAVGLASAVGKLHQHGLVHKDLKPANVLVDAAADEVRLTGFGIASRLPRERQAHRPPETIAGTLAYMAPEQTGRMNRSIDSRSDLYALGVTLYEVLTGVLPFSAVDPMEWVHCHLARQPLPPVERRKEIPAAISAIVMKLLAKRAEDRYQTAAGLEADLRTCQAEWESHGRIRDFPLGEHDTPDRLLIPERLYGRRAEVETLLVAFDRVVGGGGPALVLVSGYSGIGKSSVVQELQPVLVPPRGIFASGKFDQYKRDIPYSTLAQAFQGLIRPLLGKNEAELAGWREALRDALGPNAALIADLVPEVKLVMGETSPVPELPPLDAQRRFQMVVQQFIGVFARPEHPLTLFLDDLQWLDAATIDLVDAILRQADLCNLLLIGAYRDNEVTAAHPLARRIEALRETGRVEDIRLARLTGADVESIVSDSLRCGNEVAAPLAALVHAKTDGNPFFVIQFLHALADEGLVAFNHRQTRWAWDLAGIHAKQYTDNVVDLLATKLTRLPIETQESLRQLACLGNVADVAMLSVALGRTRKEVHAALWEGVRQQLIERAEGAYRFVHDRVQEAAYALIPEALRAEAHLAIGRMLATHTAPEKLEEAIFEIVTQFNRGAPLIRSAKEREQVAELNLIAGRRAMASSAYASALTFFTTGAVLLPGAAWDRRQDLAFALQLHAADCEISTGAAQAAEERLAALAARAIDTVQRCLVAHRRVDLYVILGAGERAVTVALEGLRQVGIDWPTHPTDEQARREYDRIRSVLGNRAIEDIVDLPPNSDPASRATLDVLTSLILPALYTDLNLYALCVCMATNLSLEHGNSDGAPVNYAGLALIAGPRFGHYEDGYRFGRVGCDLLERGGLTHFGARTYSGFAIVVPWTRVVREGLAPSRRAFQMAKDHGDPTYAAIASRGLSTILLASGHPLEAFEREAEDALEFVQRFGFFLDRLSAPIALARTLRGRNAKFGSLDGAGFTEDAFEQRATGQPSRAFLECFYWLRKLQARFFAGDLVSALAAAEKVEHWYCASPALSLFPMEKAEFHCYAALARAACCEPTGHDRYAVHRDALAGHERALHACAARCPGNFEDRASLVGAEIARLEGRTLDAMDLYERALACARESGFVQHEALACELAARLYATRGYHEIAHGYLRSAHRAYLRWGAEAKARQLEELHPTLGHEDHPAAPTGTIEAKVEHLDLATVLKVSQAVSGEMVLERLIDRLMRTAIEHAGAERGLLVEPQGEQLRVDAEVIARGAGVVVHLRENGTLPAAGLPQSLVRYVMRARETVLIDDASSSNSFSTDPYIARRHARSILCLPLIHQGKLIAILYLENNLMTHAFTAQRLTVLKVLASQAAISLENSRLYRDLAERESRIRRLVDANIIGILIWDLEGRILEANEAFLTMLGYTRADLDAGRLHWTDLTPPEWRDRDERLWLPELEAKGALQPFEKEYFRKDGGRVPVLIGVAMLDEAGAEGVAFVLDLTEQKRAQKALDRASADLAHGARVSMLGELTASIAHEVNQPLTAIATNVEAGLRWLERDTPPIDEVRALMGRVAKNTRRAADVIQRVRNMAARGSKEATLVGIDGVVRDASMFLQHEMHANHVVVTLELVEGLPEICVDRIQIQQVIVNLAINAIQAMTGVPVGRRRLRIATGLSDEHHVFVRVDDTGPGISAESMPRLFERFYSTKSEGMGMGLPICHSIVEAHGGRIEATNKDGAGACFWFTLPIAGSSG